MADLFNEDFQDLIQLLNKHNVEYILLAGYAVILHGDIRSTADMDIRVNKTAINFQKLKKLSTCLFLFGLFKLFILL